jgi:uncharacterized protein
MKKTFLVLFIAASLLTLLTIPASAKSGGVEDIEHFKWLISYAPKNIDSFWADSFAGAKVPYRRVAVVFYDQPIETPCGKGIANNAFYCEKSNTIYADIDFLYRQFLSYGDYAVVNILAHEFGHAVQTQLGIADPDIFQELRADCLCGVYTVHASQKGILSNGDIEEAEMSLYKVGDNGSWEKRGAHGRPEQRVNNFRLGLQYGIGGCFK